MKYYGGCDAGSTYTKCVILDETGKMVASVTLKSKINTVESAQLALDEAVKQVEGLKDAKELFIVAGAPACSEDLQALGINNFINVRSNVLETLKTFNAQLLNK